MKVFTKKFLVWVLVASLPCFHSGIFAQNDRRSNSGGGIGLFNDSKMLKFAVGCALLATLIGAGIVFATEYFQGDQHPQVEFGGGVRKKSTVICIQEIPKIKKKEEIVEKKIFSPRYPLQLSPQCLLQLPPQYPPQMSRLNVPKNEIENKNIALIKKNESVGTSIGSPRGFDNRGNECYLNAILSMFLNNTVFRKFLLNHGDEINNLFKQDNDSSDVIAKKYVENETNFKVPSEEMSSAWSIFCSAFRNLRKKVDNINYTINKDLDEYLKKTCVNGIENIDTDKYLKMILVVELFRIARQIDQKTQNLDKKCFASCLRAFAKFNNGQQDASEAFIKICEALELLEMYEPNKQALRNILGFETATRYKCPSCKNIFFSSSKIESTQTKDHHYLQILNLINSESKSNELEKLPKKVDSESNPNELKNLLKNADFYTTESDFGNKVAKQECPCGGKLFCVNLWKLYNNSVPSLLCFYFNRNSSAQCDKKNSTEVLIPKIFDIKPYVEGYEDEKKSCLYELCGVTVHGGDSAKQGHYVSLVKNESGEWFKHNDAVVTEVTKDFDTMCTQSSMALYQLQGSSANSEKIFEK